MLLLILDSFQTKSLVHFAPTCRRFHSLILRLIHRRLQLAADLDRHLLYLECGPPAAKWTTPKVLCTTLGTSGMQELSHEIESGRESVGLLKKMGLLYTRFRPQQREPDWLTLGRPHPAGDIPGSRTYVPTEAAASRLANFDNRVTRTVAIDADMSFSQLQTFAFLAKRERTRGLISQVQSVAEGTIRVWKDWLSKQCESKGWTDGENIAIIQEDCDGNRKARSDSFTGVTDPHKDPNIIWINTGRNILSIKFRVKQQMWRAENPILIHTAAAMEMPVSYLVELEGEYNYPWPWLPCSFLSQRS
jgi:hypothetical protein